MMGRLQVICTTDQIKEAKRNVQKYMRKHKSDEDFIKNISDDFVMGFMISQRMACDDCERYARHEPKRHHCKEIQKRRELLLSFPILY